MNKQLLKAATNELVSKPKEEENEDLHQSAIDIAASVGVDIERSDINVVHRLGHKHSGQRKPRGIICRFVTRRVKMQI